MTHYLIYIFKTGCKIEYVQDDDGWMPLDELNMYCHIIRSSNDNAFIAYVCILWLVLFHTTFKNK